MVSAPASFHHYTVLSRGLIFGFQNGSRNNRISGQAHGAGVGQIWVYVDVDSEGGQDTYSRNFFRASRLLRFLHSESNLHQFSEILKKTDRKNIQKQKS